MPSANPKLEKQASTETVEPIRQAIIVIEHKIRNLEKRKVKLESYKDLQKNGRELNTDQKTAVAKYDEVLQTLDITRELYKQILGIAQEAVKQQKKMARKEAIERMQQDIAKVREVLLIQDALMNMGTDSIREDFLTGKNGAVKLSEEDLKYLDSLYNEVMTKHHREGEPTFLQQVQKVAEHYVAIVDGKQREVVGTTYNKLKEIINSINQCGYFDQVREVETAVEVTEAIAETQVSEIPAQEQISEEYSSSERHIPPESMIPIPNFPVQVAPLPVVSGTAPVSAPRINDVIGTPNFFFLQESELDSPDVTSQAPIVEKTEENQDETIAPESELEQPNEPVDWCQITDANDWNQVDQSQQPTQDSQQEQQQQQQTSQQAWGDQQRSGYKGRGGKRGNSNGYNGRGRGSGYQQNGRGGQGTYYRNDSNYQNGYQQRSWGNNEGNGGYNSGYKRGGGGPRGGPRGERGMDRGSRGQFRGQRGGNRGGYTPRGKPHAQQ
ncbi:Caprin like protein [Dufourea novaeangliae]|uniref:Caprin like protein n=1 Tax=Dufourea novaeangliae TaxID=178035 RepID=A0A154PL49_DUFNO|nr:Caprin like protein [Dufourea novaeangliae]